MDTNRSSPRQLQGPRPSPLKVRKDSYKITKTPPTLPTIPNPPPRPPVIIYTVSPKIIHTNPSDFMTLVQRLTGPDSAPVDESTTQQADADDEFEDKALLDIRATSSSNPPGELSPKPPTAPSFSSPNSTFDAGAFGFLQDLSPGPNAGFFISPRNLLATPTVPSPGAAWDIFNQL